MFGVGGYIIARVLAILLPLFFVNQPGQEDLAIRIVLILENIVLWGFLGALAYIFRSAPTLPAGRQTIKCDRSSSVSTCLCISEDVILRRSRRPVSSSLAFKICNTSRRDATILAWLAKGANTDIYNSLIHWVILMMALIFTCISLGHERWW